MFIFSVVFNSNQQSTRGFTSHGTELVWFAEENDERLSAHMVHIKDNIFHVFAVRNGNFFFKQLICAHFFSFLKTNFFFD